LKDAKILPNPNAETQNFNNPPSKRIDDLFKHIAAAMAITKSTTALRSLSACNLAWYIKSANIFESFITRSSQWRNQFCNDENYFVVNHFNSLTSGNIYGYRG
jgi:hypothetical protein